MKHDYTGFQLLEPPAIIGWTKLCPQCEGHGGWFISKHLDQHCSHCNGYGYVHQDNDCPGHDWREVEQIGRCLTRNKCTICGAEREVDSSD